MLRTVSLYFWASKNQDIENGLWKRYLLRNPDKPYPKIDGPNQFYS